MKKTTAKIKPSNKDLFHRPPALTALAVIARLGGLAFVATAASPHAGAATGNHTMTMGSSKKAATHHNMGASRQTASAGSPYAHTTKLAFSSSPAVIPFGKPSTWTLRITNAVGGSPVKDFEIEMTKKMHLIVVKSDLSWFNHIHPLYKGNGAFVVTTILPAQGSYKLYADFTPSGRKQEVSQYMLATGGRPYVAAAAVPIADIRGIDGWLVKRVKSHPESMPETGGGSEYQIALMTDPVHLVAGKDAMLHFQVRDSKGKPVFNLQPYLGAMGHAVILSADTNAYLHSHPMIGGNMKGMGMKGMGMKGMGMKGMGMKGMDTRSVKGAKSTSSGPDVTFHTNFPSAGIYKVWGQFQHEGKIITAAFVLKVDAH